MVGDELDLETIAVLEVSGVVLGSPSVGMAVSEQECPSVLDGAGDELVELCDITGTKGEVRAPAPAGIGRARRR